MDLKGYEIKNTTKCVCGHEFTIKDMKKLQRINDSKFYGGIVRHVDEIKCPKCNKDTLLLIKQTGQTYIVKDIAQKSDELNNNSDNELICLHCKREFKSKSGLIRHMQIHNN